MLSGDEAGEGGALLLPCGVLDLFARYAGQLIALDAVNHADGIAMRGDHVIPASRGPLGLGDAEDPIRERVAQVVIEEQPPVQVLIPNLFLYARQVHVSSLSNSSWAIPSISTTFMRLVKPVTIRTRARGTRASSAKKRMHSSFALPSTGGAARSSFQASPRRPAMVVRLARG